MGAVWLAEDTRLHRQVALKMVRPADISDELSRARLMREARAAAALNHPHIATVHDVLEDEGQVVIVLEYVEGETLHERIARGAIPPPEAVDIAVQIAKALVHAHAHGVVHRDLKPANVIFGAGGHIKVLDFGVARMLSANTTHTGGHGPSSSHSSLGLIGTPGYAAPEQMVSGAVDPRADLYALGVVLFEMISGRRPFVGSDVVKLATAKLSKDAPPLSSSGQLIPPALDQLVASLLARDPDGRPPSATDALSALRAIYGTPSTGSLRVPGRSRAVAIAAGVLLVIAIAGAGLWQSRRFAVVPDADGAPQVIAVLPFVNNSGDPSKDFVAAGIAESLISSLAALPTITVLSRASVAEARGRVKDESALAKDLGATYLVNGGVQASGDVLKVSLNLVRPDRTVAWGESVEGRFEHIFDLQSRLVSTLTSALETRVSASERERMRAQPTTNSAALSAYWRGQALLERRDITGNIPAAIAAFSDAIALDPKFALAHAALGTAYWAYYLETKAPEWTERAVNAGTAALRIDPNQPEVRYAVALTLAGRGRAAEAIDELHRALAMRPNYDDARRQLALILGRQGRVDEAITEYQKALALRPNSSSTYGSMGVMLFEAARYDAAIVAFTKFTELQPDNFMGFSQLGSVYHTLGKTDLALANYRRANALRNSAATLSNIGVVHHDRGEFAQAVEAYRQSLELRPNSATTTRNLGDALSRMGEQEEARRAYQRAAAMVEADLKVNPQDARLLATLAVYLTKAGDARRARARLAEALSRAPNDVDVLYRAAAIHAIDRQDDEAMRFLRRAVAAGYSRARVTEEDDFEGLRKRKDFQELVQSAKP